MNLSPCFPVQLDEKKKAIWVGCEDVNRNFTYSLNKYLLSTFRVPTIGGSKLAGRKEEN